MKKLFALLLMLVLPLMAGCLTDDSGDKDEENGGGSGSGSGVSATAYLPLKTGSTYAYRETNTYGDVTEPDIYNLTSTVGTTVSKNGKTYTMMTDAYDGWTDTTYVRIANNIVYALETFYDMYIKQAAKAGVTVPKLADDYTSVEVPMINFDANTWTIYTNSDTNEYGTFSISWTGRYVGRESVTVPAGTFANCVVFELTMEDESSYSYGGFTYSSTGEDKMKIWCAQGVGWVKTHSVYSFDDGSGQVHGSDVMTTELTSYSIP